MKKNKELKDIELKLGDTKQEKWQISTGDIILQVRDGKLGDDRDMFSVQMQPNHSWK